jgi:Xaa-Pro aminopeptidase
LEWLTGFTGSNGIAVILSDKAALFTDGRYLLQAAQEVDNALYKIFDMSTHSLVEYAGELVIGYDPFLHSSSQISNFKNSKPCPNLIDIIWLNQPARPTTPIFQYPEKFAGQKAEEKIKLIAQKLVEQNVDACLITELDSICWLLNVRANDVPYNPIMLAYAIIHREGRVDVFSDREPYLPMAELGQYLDQLQGKKVLVDPRTAPIWFENKLKNIIKGDNPCILPKACKNNVEVAMAKEIHAIDGVALSRFLYWLDSNQLEISELDVADKLLELRQQNSAFIYPSFATIAGFAEHGAIIHYHPTTKTNKIISGNGLLLVDSGGQYYGGTTDVTRTIAIGEPTEEQKYYFTLVLKGHLKLAMARVPKNTTGAQLDLLARNALWNQGADYPHGTGHGVGNCLNVHEGPQSISRNAHDVKLKPGMIFSNEPGYYKEGEYGIRIESLLVVEEDGEFNKFHTLTLAPIDPNLIRWELLDYFEKKWLYDYHLAIAKTLPGYYPDEGFSKWLDKVAARYEI